MEKLNHSDIIYGPYQMSVDITNMCNYRCLHCYNFSGDNNCIQNELSEDEIIRLINDIAEIKPLSICLCGGEPLLKKELLYKVIAILSNKGIDTAFVSNGYLLNEDVAKKLKDVGLSRVQISLDGLKYSHDHLRNFDGAFEKTISALKNLQTQHLNTGIAFTPTKWNIDDFEDVVKICDELGVKEIRLQRTMPIGRGGENDIIPTESQYRQLKKKFHELKSKFYKMRFEWGDPIDHLIRFPKYNQMCCPHVTIKANGNIVPSMYLPISAGNIRCHSIQEYWSRGLGRIWENQYLRSISSKILTMDELNLQQLDLPLNFKEQDLDIDIFENRGEKYGN